MLRGRIVLLVLFVSAACNPTKPKAGTNETTAALDKTPPAVGTCNEARRPIEGRAGGPIPKRPKPAKGLLHEEPTYRTCMVRATDHAQEEVDGFSRADYSRRQAFNADSSLFITNAKDGSWHLYETSTLKKLETLTQLSGDAEPQWHPKDPNVLWYGERNGGLTITALDVKTRTTKVAIALAGKLPWPKAARAWTKSEGSPSRDARYWPLQVETDGFEILGFAVWDLVEGKLVGSMATSARPDHVSMSPSGRWFVASGDGETVAYSPDFKQRKTLRKGGEHSDLAVGKDGHDYYVSIDYQKDGDLFMTDIDTGERTDLFRTYVDHAAAAMHFSGKAFDRPGWVLVSTYRGVGPKQWYMDKVMAVELAKKPRVYQLAAHHSDVDKEYFAEPHATVNRDFTRILFNSNWDQKGSLDVDAYLLRLPLDALP
jgi:hypothetical protein